MGGTPDDGGGGGGGGGGVGSNGKRQAGKRDASEEGAAKKPKNDAVNYFADRKAADNKVRDRVSVNESLAAAAKLHLAASEEASKK